jgi:hypothetical protein
MDLRTSYFDMLTYKKATKQKQQRISSIEELQAKHYINYLW